MAGRRLDTRLEAEGAEFLVCGQLLIEGIATYKTYTQMPGYDLVATAPDQGRIARIQVKSRWASDHDASFPLKSLDCDFVVFVALNRGNRYRTSQVGKKAPEYFVFPVQVAGAARRDAGWNKVMMRRIEGLEGYRENWGLIRAFLHGDGPARASEGVGALGT